MNEQALRESHQRREAERVSRIRCCGSRATGKQKVPIRLLNNTRYASRQNTIKHLRKGGKQQREVCNKAYKCSMHEGVALTIWHLHEHVALENRGYRAAAN